MKKKGVGFYIFLFTMMIFILFSLPVLGDTEAKNLLINGDFEKGNVNGWEREKWNEGGVIDITESYVFKGKYSCRIFSGTTENDIRLTQEIQVEPNTYYMLSGWIATEKVQEGRIGANISLISGFHSAGNVEGTKGWKYYKLVFKTSKNHFYIKIAARLGMYYNTVKGTAYFDDLRLEKLDYTPNYCIMLKDPEGNNNPPDEEKQIEYTKKNGRTDPVFEKLNFPLIGILMLIGLMVVILNIFFTVFREKRNAHKR